MKDHCDCGHCHCDDELEKDKEGESPENKIENLKKAIADLGYHIEETENGDIRISE